MIAGEPIDSCESSSAIAASTPAAAAKPRPMSLASRAPNRKAPSSASRPPARAANSHSFGAAPPNSPNTVVNTTGSGFQDGPPLVANVNAPEAISRPHTIHAHGS